MARWEPPLWADRLAGVAWRFIVVIAAAAIVVAGVVALSPVVLPVVLGALFTSVLHPIDRKLRQLGVPRTPAALLAVLVLVAALVAVGFVTINAVVDQWDDIVVLLDDGSATLRQSLTDVGVDADTAATIEDDVHDGGGRILSALVGGVLALVPTIVGVAAAVLLSLVVTLFFLRDGELMWRWVLDRLGGAEPLAARIGERVWRSLSGFMMGQTAIAAVDSTLIALSAAAIGVPHVGAVLLLTFFGAYIPFIGAFVSGLVAVVLALSEGGLRAGVAMLVAIIAVQVLEGNVLQPWIQGKAVSLHPLVVALAVAGGGALAGILGVFLSVPVAAAAVVTLSELRAAGVIGLDVDDPAAPPALAPDDGPAP